VGGLEFAQAALSFEFFDVFRFPADDIAWHPDRRKDPEPGPLIDGIFVYVKRLCDVVDIEQAFDLSVWHKLAF